MTLARDPHPMLRPFVRLLWSQEAQPEARRSSAQGAPGAFERMLPTGDTHIAIRLSGEPIRMPDGDGAIEAMGFAVVGGPRLRPYLRDVSVPGASVGAVLRPGAARLLLGPGAETLAGRHWRLDDFWGAAAAALRERLQEADSGERRLEIFEGFLAARLPEVHGVHPAVAAGLAVLRARGTVAAAVEAGGCSHRRFLDLFGEAVGLNPKSWARVRRFQRAVRALARPDGTPWATLALDLGYSDQAHFSREFHAFAGLTPSEYAAAAPVQPNHVPAGQICSRPRAGRRA